MTGETRARRLTATVTGHVQGVGYRQFARFHARRLNLSGWVRNHWDGSVQLVAEGDESRLAQLLLLLEQGPPLSRVEKVDAEYGDASGEFEGFGVRR